MSSALQLAEWLARKAKVLLVDDDACTRLVVVSCLENLGVECLAVESGEEAIKILSERSFDLILLDLRLHDVSGADVLKLIRAKHISTPVVLVTGYVQDALSIALTELGVVSVISKPFTCGNLCGAVKRVLDTYKLRCRPNECALAWMKESQAEVQPGSVVGG